MNPTMAEMIHADAVRREKLHGKFRVALGQRAADLFNAFVQDCVSQGVDLDEIDATVLWNAAMSTARQELQPEYMMCPGPAAILEANRRALPDYRRPNG